MADLKAFKSLTLLNILLTISFCFSASAINYKFQNQSSAEQDFNAFLENAFKNYSHWLVENGHDPTETIPEPVIIESTHFPLYPALVIMEISDQTVSGYSKPADDIQTQTSFEEDYYNFRAGRNMTEEYIFSGKYNLTGFVRADSDNGPPNDIPFTGQGEYIIKTAPWSYEFFDYRRFEITEDGYIDLSNSRKDYTFSMELGEGEFNGLVLSEEAKRYENKIILSLNWLYASHLRNSTVIGLSPTRRLFSEYMDNIITTTPLSEIISGGILPPFTSSTPAGTSTTPGSSGSMKTQLSTLILFSTFTFSHFIFYKFITNLIM